MLKANPMKVPMSDWNPESYLQFRNARTRPSIDLVTRIPSADPRAIIDFGCGPGNSTQVLAHRWPRARVLGLDQSPAMIETARSDYPGPEWIVADAATYETEETFDIVFSNATIQWIPDHEALLARWRGLLGEGGVLAVQMPLFWEMPLGQLIDRVSRDPRWRRSTEHVSSLFTIHDYRFYYDRLTDLFARVDVWETTYMDVLASHRSVVELIKSTGLKPYLDSLDGLESQEAFEQDVLRGVEEVYPSQRNGKVILPFKRLFFIGQNVSAS